MALRKWNLDQLKDQLSKDSRIKGWIITRENVHRRERYFLSESGHLAVDQDRDARSQNVFGRIFVELSDPQRQGEIARKFFPELPLEEQIEAALASAQQTDHQRWELPAPPSQNLPNVASTDPRMAEDLERVMGEMTEEVSRAVAKKRLAEFNSAELFLSVHHRELHVSNGMVHRSSQSRIYAEAAYSARKQASGHDISDEYLNTLWSVSLDDLSIEKLFNETAERAMHTLDVRRPEGGKYAVLIDAETLAILLGGQIHQLNAVNAYNRLPFIQPGKPLIQDAGGDLLSITLDPRMEFGGDTIAVSDQGVIQQPQELVKENQVVATMADKQYADYIGTAVTTTRGNMIVAPGTLGYEELIRQAPLVLEVLQFSALFPDSNSGTFSSEIRLARLHDNIKKTVSYIKGGSLSGSIAENFKNARFSRNRVKRSHFSSNSARGEGYFGPEHALLSDVMIVS